jgi:hypothetical protein
LALVVDILYPFGYPGDYHGEPIEREQTVAKNETDEWGGLDPAFTVTLKETKVEPVPDAIVKLAQRSLDGEPHPKDDSLIMHAMNITFESPERAEAFAAHMRNAGPHTTPMSSITVVVDPERQKVPQIGADGQPVTKDGKTVMVPGEPVNPSKVAWRAGTRRGKAPAGSNGG